MRFLLLLLPVFFVSAIDIPGLPIDIPDLPIDIPDIPLPGLEDLNPVKIAQLFAQFILNFKKEYANPLEQSKALAAFGDNLKKIIQFNLDFSDQLVKFGLNQYSDLSDADFAKTVLLKDAPTESSQSSQHSNSTFNFQTAPASFDWRKTPNVVGLIRNQGSCGCCWAFTTAALVQTAYGIKNKKLIQPSEQQLCDCGMQDSTYAGCRGGSVGVALDYAQNHGVSLDTAYTAYSPTRATKAGTCDDKKKPNNYKISSYERIMPVSSFEMQAALPFHGPLGIAFKVGASFRHYKSGIFNNNDCSTPKTFLGYHAVQVVGYGEEKGVRYWIVKNSWGPNFGEKGYFRFIKGTKLCGFETTEVHYATA